MKVMNIKLVAVALAGLALGVLAAVSLLPGVRDRMPSQGSASLGAAQVGGPFQLVDPAGKAVSDASFRGSYMMVYFGYTHCPDVCPAGLQVMAAALDKLGPKAERVVPVFITLDPARDSGKSLGDYVRSFHPRLVGLTGSEQAIADVAKAYRVYSRKVVDPKAPADYTLDHTSVIYIMGPSGEFAMHFTHASTPDAIAERLGKVL